MCDRRKVFIATRVSRSTSQALVSSCSDGPGRLDSALYVNMYVKKAEHHSQAVRYLLCKLFKPLSVVLKIGFFG